MTALTLRPLSTGEILDVSFALYRKHFVALATVAIVVQGIPILMQVYAENTGGVLGNPTAYLLSLLAGLIGATIGMGASMEIISDSYLGREIGARQALARSFPYFGRLIVLSTLSGLLVGMGLFLLILPGIFLACSLGVGPQALVLENQPDAGAAMSRSWSLTRGFRGKVFLTYFVVMLLVYLSSAAAMVLAGLLVGFSDNQTVLLVVMMILASLFTVLIYPYVYAAATVLYYDLRVRKEGFDLEMLEQALQAA